MNKNVFKGYKAALVALGVLAYAAGANAQYIKTQNIGKVITPDIATGAVSFVGTVDQRGEILACVQQDKVMGRKTHGECRVNDRRGYYLPMKAMVPEGREFVGFSIAGWSESGTRYYVYWK